MSHVTALSETQYSSISAVAVIPSYPQHLINQTPDRHVDVRMCVVTTDLARELPTHNPHSFQSLTGGYLK